MSLNLLLDEHIDPKLAEMLRARGIETVSVHEWQSGHYVSHPDEEILIAADSEHLTLISYDVHSIPELLQRLGQEAIAHSGVVLISERTLKPNALSALAQAIQNLVSDLGDVDWRNRLVFLHR